MLTFVLFSVRDIRCNSEFISRPDCILKSKLRGATLVQWDVSPNTVMLKSGFAWVSFILITYTYLISVIWDASTGRALSQRFLFANNQTECEQSLTSHDSHFPTLSPTCSYFFSFSPPIVSSSRLVVWCLRPLQSKRNVLHRWTKPWETERDQVALLQGA